jgi:hypothetical protein
MELLVMLTSEGVVVPSAFRDVERLVMQSLLNGVS